MAKKMNPWALVGIGCGGIVLLGVVIMVGLGLFAVRKGEQLMEDMERNPAHAMAKILAATNPEIEIVDANDEDQTVTLRNKTTGEDVVLDLEGLKNGKIAWETSEGRVEIDADGDNGKVNIKGPDGQSAQFGNAVDVPKWVPVYPGGMAQGVAAVTGADGSSNGMVAMNSEDSRDDVLAWYKNELSKEGYTEEGSSTMSSDGQTVSTVRFVRGNDSISMAFASNEGETGTRVNISYVRQN